MIAWKSDVEEVYFHLVKINLQIEAPDCERDDNTNQYYDDC